VAGRKPRGGVVTAGMRLWGNTAINQRRLLETTKNDFDENQPKIVGSRQNQKRRTAESGKKPVGGGGRRKNREKDMRQGRGEE